MNMFRIGNSLSGKRSPQLNHHLCHFGVRSIQFFSGKKVLQIFGMIDGIFHREGVAQITSRPYVGIIQAVQKDILWVHTCEGVQLCGNRSLDAVIAADLAKK